jgi:hypothetical protein
LAVALAALLVSVAPAGAVFSGRSPTPPPKVRSTTNTQLILTSTGYGQGVSGFIADPDNPFDPVAEGYPTSDPTTGFTPRDEGFAGVIHAQPPGGGTDISLYCIDISTDTWIGVGYGLGTWNEANVPNVGYVARLLNEYYPTTDEPASLPDLNEKAAAVQAAIWFFSDRYVLRSDSRLHNTVAGIVDHIIAQGPLLEPPPPSLTLTPSHVDGPAGHVLGPITLTTDQATAAVTATGGSMFSDAAGTAPIANGAQLPSGQKIWVRSTGPATAVLNATAVATVPTGNVYLYDGNAGVAETQRLILARTATLTTTVQATAEFRPPGSLVVVKRITGPAAGSQGRVVIGVTCDDGVSRRPLVIPAGTPDGARSRTYGNIAAGTVCAVTEARDGTTTGTTVVVKGDGQTVTIGAGARSLVKIADIYDHIGSLLVRKTIAGPGAGLQGPVTIHTVCNGTPLAPDLAVAAGAPAGTQTRQYDNIRLPAMCTVTETADGTNSAVSAVVEGSGQTVSLSPGAIAEADVSDTYGLLPGQLAVTKTITGPLAGQQGAITIRTVCNGTPLTPDFTIPAGTPAGDQSLVYSGITTPADCVVTEIADGGTSSVSAAVSGSPPTVTIPPGGSGAAQIIDTYGARPGSLLVTKTIAGARAGRQGQVVIRVVCNGTALTPDFVIAPRTGAGSVSRSFDGIPAGSACTVTETADGGSLTAPVTVTGSPQTVTVPAGTVVPVSITDVYRRPASSSVGAEFLRLRNALVVTKHITGPVAGRQGRISILVDCGPTRAFAFIIPAGTRPGLVSRAFTRIPPGTRCTVTETENGATAAVAVAVTGRRQTVTIPPRGRATARITDYYQRSAVAPGSGLG